MLYLTNTLTGKKEEFKPIHKGEASMYNCGPTVYYYAHIGNLRAYIFADILRRALEYLGYKVKQIINVTDIGHLQSDADEGEDKMTLALKREGKSLSLEAMKEVASFYFEAFKNDLEKLNIKFPDKFPFASEHIKEDIELIQKLTEKGFTYKTSDGIYYDISKYPQYGKLGNQKSNETDSRVINPEKRNSKDFALWKFSAQGGSDSVGNVSIGYESPFGKGFPGWHIECSAMSMKYLGETFDIHTGGVDHIPVHHNNEIAQSEAATGQPLANYWLHNAFLNMENAKMAKSEGNILTLKVLEEKGIHPLSYRFFLLQARYGSPVNFSWEALEGAQSGFTRLVKQLRNFEIGKVDQNYLNKFKELIEDDLDTPAILALIQEILKNDSLTDADKKATILEFDKVLGLNLDKVELRDKYLEITSLPQEIQDLISDRETARTSQNWSEADKIRKTLEERGYEIEDQSNGPRILKV